MTMTLVDQINALEWSDDARRMYQGLMQHSASDEAGAVVLVAAAALLAREYPTLQPADRDDLADLVREFGALVREVRRELSLPRPPYLRLVGGHSA